MSAMSRASVYLISARGRVVVWRLRKPLRGIDAVLQMARTGKGSFTPWHVCCAVLREGWNCKSKHDGEYA